MNYKTCAICGNKYPRTREYFYASTKQMSEGKPKHWGSYCITCCKMYSILYYVKDRFIYRYPPAFVRFKNKAAVLQYLSGEKVECLLCGKKYLSLAIHLIRSHNMKAKQYKFMFNIPLSLTLTSAGAKRQRKTDYLKTEKWLKRLADSYNPQANVGKKKPKPDITKKACGMKIMQQGNKIPIEINCSVCGQEYNSFKNHIARLQVQNKPHQCLKCIRKKNNKKHYLKELEKFGREKYKERKNREQRKRRRKRNHS